MLTPPNSGGQKVANIFSLLMISYLFNQARITLARAIYSNANILLLDDVLAALDVHTAKWIVDKCFQGDLVKGRTVILVVCLNVLPSSTTQISHI